MQQHNGALLVMQLWIFEHGDREHFVVASEPDSPHVRIVCTIECLLPSLSVGCDDWSEPLFHF